MLDDRGLHDCGDARLPGGGVVSSARLNDCEKRRRSIRVLADDARVRRQHHGNSVPEQLGGHCIQYMLSRLNSNAFIE